MKYLSLLAFLLACNLFAGQIRYEDQSTPEGGSNNHFENDTKSYQSFDSKEEIQREEDRDAAKPESAIPADIDEDEIGEPKKGSDS